MEDGEAGRLAGSGIKNPKTKGLTAKSKKHQKNGPCFSRGQVALVLSRCESFFGGLRRGGRWRECRASGEELAAYCGCSAPAAAGALWGDAAAWAAKLFSITLRCTLLNRTRSGFWV